MTCDDKASVAAAKSVMYREEQREAVFFSWWGGGVRGGNIIMRAQKIRNCVSANTVPVTVVPCTVIQEPVFLVRICNVIIYYRCILFMWYNYYLELDFWYMF